MIVDEMMLSYRHGGCVLADEHSQLVGGEGGRVDVSQCLALVDGGQVVGLGRGQVAGVVAHGPKDQPTDAFKGGNADPLAVCKNQRMMVLARGRTNSFSL